MTTPPPTTTTETQKEHKNVSGINALLETDLNSLKTSIQIGDKKEKEKRSQELPGLTLLT